MTPLILSILLWAHPQVFHGGNHMVPLQTNPIYSQFKSFRTQIGPTSDDYGAGEVVGINFAINYPCETAPGNCSRQAYISISDLELMMLEILEWL
jgi:hypothetical protein